MKIAINGFGRIGRVFYRQASNNPDFEIATINDLVTKIICFICWNMIQSMGGLLCRKKLKI